MQVKIENLSYSYGSKKLKVKAVNDICLEIKEGEFFGVVGHTGSGKSTLIQHLNGLIKVQKDSGKVIVGEYDLTDKKCDFKGLRAKVGMVFQYPEYQLFAETVFEDVKFGLKNFYPNLTEKEMEERIKKAVETVGLDYEKIKEKSPFELSGGQKRRVAIAGVIVSRPEVLVLDEPVAGLDPTGKREFVSLLHALHNDFVKTIIIVSHDMNLIAENCDRVAVLNKGNLVKVGTPKEVFMDKVKVEEWGLELPSTAYLTEKLREKGIEIDSDLTIKGFIDGYIRAKGGEK
ncbi:MAG: energy-coupling factor transporter ATPase [Clostridia bacterium]|nr:energy-coupling factor transporter ATPase [Clostridia bacterium]